MCPPVASPAEMSSFVAGAMCGTLGALGLAIAVNFASGRWARRQHPEEPFLGPPSAETLRRMTEYGRMDPFMRRKVRVQPPSPGGGRITEVAGASYASFEELENPSRVDEEMLQRLRDEFEDADWAVFDPQEEGEEGSKMDGVREEGAGDASESARKTERLAHYASVRAEARGVAWPDPGAEDEAAKFPFNSDMLRRREAHEVLGTPREPRALNDEFPLPSGVDEGPGGGDPNPEGTLGELVDGRRSESKAEYAPSPPPSTLAPREACQAIAYSLLREGGEGELTRLGGSHPIFSTPTSPLAPRAASTGGCVYECPLGVVRSDEGAGAAYATWLEGIGRRGCDLRIVNAYFAVPRKAPESTPEGFKVIATWHLDVPSSGSKPPHFHRVKGETIFTLDSHTLSISLVRDEWQTSRDGTGADGAAPGAVQWEIGWRTNHRAGIGRLNNPLPTDAPDPSVAADVLEALVQGLVEPTMGKEGMAPS